MSDIEVSDTRRVSEGERDVKCGEALLFVFPWSSLEVYFSSYENRHPPLPSVVKPFFAFVAFYWMSGILSFSTRGGG